MPPDLAHAHPSGILVRAPARTFSAARMRSWIPFSLHACALASSLGPLFPAALRRHSEFLDQRPRHWRAAKNRTRQTTEAKSATPAFLPISAAVPSRFRGDPSRSKPIGPSAKLGKPSKQDIFICFMPCAAEHLADQPARPSLRWRSAPWGIWTSTRAHFRCSCLVASGSGRGQRLFSVPQQLFRAGGDNQEGSSIGTVLGWRE